MRTTSGRSIQTAANRYNPVVYLGFDISLTSPGFAAISVKDRKPTLLASGSIQTDSGQPDGLRYAMIQAWTITQIYPYLNGLIPAIIREDYKRPASKRQGQTIYGAWAAVDSGLQRCGLGITDEINAATVKLRIGGSGRADKDEVAAGAALLLRLGDGHVWRNNDESDAAGIVLAWLLEKGLIDG